jgi:hypothetical protein
VTFTKAHRYIQAKERGGENGKLGLERTDRNTLPREKARGLATRVKQVHEGKFSQNAKKRCGCSTGTSREVTHPSTIPAQRRLTAEF